MNTKKIKPIHLILFGLLVIIWIIAVRRLVVYSGRSEGKVATDYSIDKNKVNTPAAYKDDRAEFVYSRSFRNPFLDPGKHNTVKIEPQPPIIIIKPPPRVNFTVEGIIVKKGHSLAIISDVSGNTGIHGVGDNIKEFVVSDITRDSVIVMTQDSQFRLALPIKKK